jgi:hypothetical protein
VLRLVLGDQRLDLGVGLRGVLALRGQLRGVCGGRPDPLAQAALAAWKLDLPVNLSTTKRS